MVSNAPTAGVDLSEKKVNGRNDVETGSTDIEPAPAYIPDDAEKDGSEEINYHTLSWWYVYAKILRHHRALKLICSLTGKREWS
jgi:hypothetical protein